MSYRLELAEVRALSRETGQSQAAFVRGWLMAGLAAQTSDASSDSKQ